MKLSCESAFPLLDIYPKIEIRILKNISILSLSLKQEFYISRMKYHSTLKKEGIPAICDNMDDSRTLKLNRKRK